MHIKDDSGVLVHISLKEKNKTPQQASKQAGNLNLDDFDYDIPQAPSTEAQVNTVSTKQQAHSRTLNKTTA